MKYQYTHGRALSGGLRNIAWFSSRSPAAHAATRFRRPVPSIPSEPDFSSALRVNFANKLILCLFPNQSVRMASQVAPQQWVGNLGENNSYEMHRSMAFPVYRSNHFG